MQLSAALRGSEAYKAFREVSRKVSEEPQLRQRLDEFRKKNYLLQNGSNAYDLFDDVQNLEREYAEESGYTGVSGSGASDMQDHSEMCG